MNTSKVTQFGSIADNGGKELDNLIRRVEQLEREKVQWTIGASESLRRSEEKYQAIFIDINN